MLIFKVFWTTFRGYFKSRRELVWENGILRYQIGVLKRKRRRIFLKRLDRPLLLWLSRHIGDLKKSLLIIQPETLVRWHRKGFALFWGWKFSKKAGRCPIPSGTIHLIREMSRMNPLWGAPRIHGELLKLGVNVAQSTVEKYMIKAGRRPNQPWKTFLKNHAKDIVAIDFFIVPTIRFRMLWSFVVLSHDRREILHVATSYNPSSAWVSQQLRNAFPFKPYPRFLIHDRDRNFWGLKFPGERQIITAYRSPWQNGYVERVIGSIRRECTDHLVVLGEKHLLRILKEYRRYYNRSRTHLSLNKDSPIPRKIQNRGRIFAIPKVGGLHHEFRRAAA